MEYTKINNLIQCCNELVAAFSENTESFPVDVVENKHTVQWSMNYNLTKIQFIFTKKEKLMCPAATLYCRIFLNKNDGLYFHIPELLEYLDTEDFRCYYFPYVETEERMKACFGVLEEWFLAYFKEINRIAADEERSANIRKCKLDEIFRVCNIKEKDRTPELLAYWIEGYERYVLLPRYAGESAYRLFLKGDYKKAIKQYRKLAEKNNHTSYEGRLLHFIENLTEPYEAICSECASVIEVEKYNGSKEEGLSILKGMLLLEVIFGGITCLLLVIIQQIMAKDSLLYYGLEWYWGFMLGCMPALFGSIAFRREIAPIIRGKNYKKALDYDELVNTNFVDRLSKGAFIGVVIFCIGMFFSCISFDTAFYEDQARFSVGDGMVSFKKHTCYYEDLEEIIYTEGVYNDYGDYIDRPSYLLLFEDGTVWDSDGYVSMEKMENEVLNLVKPYAKSIKTIESRNEYID